MKWVVLTDREGEQYQIMSRKERELMLGLYSKLRIHCPTYVVKVVESEMKAQAWVDDMKRINQLISEI
jgi:hypothetical protein